MLGIAQRLSMVGALAASEYGVKWRGMGL